MKKALAKLRYLWAMGPTDPCLRIPYTRQVTVTLVGEASDDHRLAGLMDRAHGCAKTRRNGGGECRGKNATVRWEVRTRLYWCGIPLRMYAPFAKAAYWWRRR